MRPNDKFLYFKVISCIAGPSFIYGRIVTYEVAMAIRQRRLLKQPYLNALKIFPQLDIPFPSS